MSYGLYTDCRKLDIKLVSDLCVYIYSDITKDAQNVCRKTNYRTKINQYIIQFAEGAW